MLQYRDHVGFLLLTKRSLGKPWTPGGSFGSPKWPALCVWGKNDYIFPADGAYPYQRDLENLEFHLLDTGHFALEEDGPLIAGLIRGFMPPR